MTKLLLCFELNTVGEHFMQNYENSNYVNLPLLTVGQAAKYLGVGRRIVYQLIEFGQLTVVRNRGVVRIEKKSLDTFRKSGSLV